MAQNNNSAQEQKLQEMYEKLVDYEATQHARNQKKIKIGLRLLWIIPLLFLALLFITNSNKIIFLVLWIVSLFAIASYLIIVEYLDYNLQNDMHNISGNSDAKVEDLINLDEAEGKVRSAMDVAKERIEARVEELKL